MGFAKLIAVVIALAGFMALTAPAQAKVNGTTLSIQQEVIDLSGDPALVARTSDGTLPMTWQRCVPNQACVQLPGDATYINPGESPAGTVFRLKRADPLYPEELTSSTWLGRLAATAPPSIVGTPLAGNIVKGVAGSWIGGWGTERDSVTVFACKRPTSATCTVVTGDWYPSGAEPVSRPISLRHKGWWLYAVGSRVFADDIFPLVGLGPGRPNPSLTPSVRKSVSKAFGPVKVPRGLSVKIFKRAEVKRGRFVLGAVKCRQDCEFRANIRIYNSRPKPDPTAEVSPSGVRIRRNGRFAITRTTASSGNYARIAVFDRGMLMASGVTKLR